MNEQDAEARALRRWKIAEIAGEFALCAESMTARMKCDYSGAPHIQTIELREDRVRREHLHHWERMWVECKYGERCAFVQHRTVLVMEK